MTVHLDHIAAAIAGAVVLLGLAALGVRSQSSGVETATSDALRTQIESFGGVVQSDLESLSTPVSLDGASGTFTFWARLTPHDTTQHLVEYALVAAGERGGTPVHRVTRTVDGVASGGSADLFRGWEVQTVDEAGGRASAPADVDEVYMALDAVAPFLTPDPAGPVGAEARWETRVTPIILHYRTF